MKIHYDVKGPERKLLVSAVSQELNVSVKYLGAPSFSYEAGGYSIDKNGTLEGEDNPALVADLEGLHGFKAVSVNYDSPMTYDESLGGLGALEVFEDLKMTETEELGLGKQRRDGPGEDGMQASVDNLTIEMPLDGFTERALENLERLIASKAGLIKKVIGTDALPVEQTETTLRFHWFNAGADSEEVKAYTRFICALCAKAKEQKRVTAKEKPVSSEKFAFRVFLIKLGFVGDEFKSSRKVLLKNLSGSSSFSKPKGTQQKVL